MTLDLRYRIPSRLFDDIAAAPAVFAKHIDLKASRAGLEVSREMRRQVPKAHSILANSIHSQRQGFGQYEIGPSQQHGPMVEEGTGPGGLPPARALLDWIRVKHIEPNDPTMTREDLAFVIARSIAHKGTPAQPYVLPTAEKMASRVVQLLREGLVDARREAGFA